MICQRCSSARVAHINGKTADLCMFTLDRHERDDGPPFGVGIGGGDYLRFDYCLDCGQIQGRFPIPQEKIDQAFGLDEDA
jgi:hypothetical protein